MIGAPDRAILEVAAYRRTNRIPPMGEPPLQVELVEHPVDRDKRCAEDAADGVGDEQRSWRRLHGDDVLKGASMAHEEARGGYQETGARRCHQDAVRDKTGEVAHGRPVLRWPALWATTFAAENHPVVAAENELFVKLAGGPRHGIPWVVTPRVDDDARERFG